MLRFDDSVQLPGLPVIGEPSQWIDRMPGGMSRKEFDCSAHFEKCAAGGSVNPELFFRALDVRLELNNGQGGVDLSIERTR